MEPGERARYRRGLFLRQATNLDVQRLRKAGRASLRRARLAQELLIRGSG
jgi:hypothetical protein